MTCVPAPTCRQALAEATRLWPDRRRTSDGICSSPQHQAQNPNSDHDDGNAWDLSHDPDGGPDCGLVVAAIVARKDPRVKYVIWDRTIWRSYDRPATPSRRFLKAWTPEPYTGTNAHTQHCHVSIHASARDDLRPWLAAAPPPEEDPFEMVYKDANDARRAYVREKYLDYTLRPATEKDVKDSAAFIAQHGADAWLAILVGTPEAKTAIEKQRTRLGL